MSAIHKNTDKLTGLLVEKAFEDRLEHEVQRARRYRRPLTVLVLEVEWEHFEKDLNVRAAMPYTIFKQLGALLLKQLRGVDFAGRVAGGRFCAILPETPLSGAFVAADRLRETVQDYEFLGDDLERRVRVAVNVGVASYPEHGRDADELLANAVKAIVISQSQGGNKTFVFPETLYAASDAGSPPGDAAGAAGGGGSRREEPT